MPSLSAIAERGIRALRSRRADHAHHVALATLAVAFLCAGAGLAAANSVAIVITGRVPVRNSIAVMPMPSIPAPIGRRGFIDAPLARFTGVSNALNGFSVTLVSENAARFGEPMLADGTGAPVPYSLSYGDQTLEFSGAEVTMSAAETRRGLIGAVQDLRLTAPAAADQQAQLSDTLHFIIRAN
jgi:hypothetical protein